MLAAVRTTPPTTTAGTVTPMGESPVASSKCWAIWATTAATALGVDFSGVSKRRRSAANSPVARSTGAPLMPMPSGWWVVDMRSSFRSGKREDLVAGLGDEDGVLELRGALAVLGDHGPVVGPHLPLVGAQVEHGLDRERHARLDDRVVCRRRVVVGHDQTRVEGRADAVAGEVTHHAVAEPLGVAGDHAADHVDLATRDGGLDTAHHRLVGPLHEQP